MCEWRLEIGGQVSHLKDIDKCCYCFRIKLSFKSRQLHYLDTNSNCGVGIASWNRSTKLAVGVAIWNRSTNLAVGIAELE